jgi:hypothetical protein
VGIVENHDQAYEHDEYFVVVSRAKAPIWMQYWKALQVIRTKKHILDGTRSTLEDDLAALTSVKPALIESRTPLKKETACDLLLIWASALGAIRPDTSGVIVRDGTRFVFTIYGGGGTTTSPEAASPMGAFVALGDALTRYGEASEAERVESERQLLLQVQASAKSLAADISPTASARTWNPPMACRGRRRE